MANQNLSNRSKTIRLATLSGLYPMQCRKSGAIMFSNGVQAIFVPEKRNFTRDEEVANIVSICNANAWVKKLLTTLLQESKKAVQMKYTAILLVNSFPNFQKKNQQNVTIVQTLSMALHIHKNTPTFFKEQEFLLKKPKKLSQNFLPIQKQLQTQMQL